jgi:hypothetical protein
MIVEFLAVNVNFHFRGIENCIISIFVERWVSYSMSDQKMTSFVEQVSWAKMMSPGPNVINLFTSVIYGYS